MNQSHQEDGEVFDIPQLERRQKEMDKQLFSTVFAIIYNLLWALLFHFFRHYSNDECSVINQWALYAEIFLFSVTLYKLVIELPIHYSVNKKWKIKLFEIVDYCELLLSLVMLFGLTYAYFQGEECYHLRRFVLGYLIITYLILVIYVISFIVIVTSKQQLSSQ